MAEQTVIVQDLGVIGDVFAFMGLGIIAMLGLILREMRRR